MKNYAFFIIGPFLSSAIGIFLVPLLAWTSSPALVGGFGLVQIIGSIVVAFFSLGLHQFYVREFDGVSDISQLYWKTLLPGLSLFTIFSFLLVLLNIPIADYFFNQKSNLISAIILVYFACLIIINIAIHEAKMRRASFSYFILLVIPKVVIVGYLIGSVLSGNAVGIQGLVTIVCLGAFAAVVISRYFSAARMEDLKQLKIDYEDLRRMFVFSLPLVPSGLVYWALIATDRVVIKWKLGLEIVGIYTLSTTLAAVGSVTSTVILTYWQQNVFALHEKRELLARYDSYLNALLIVVAFGWSLIGILSFSVNLLFPPQYAPLTQLLPILIGVPFVSLIADVAGVGLILERRTRTIMKIYISSFLFNCAATILFTSNFGAVGAAAASLISICILALWKMFDSHKFWYNFRNVNVQTFLYTYGFTAILNASIDETWYYLALLWICAFLITIVLNLKGARKFLSNIKIR